MSEFWVNNPVCCPWKGACHLSWFLKGLGRESWIITGCFSVDLIKCQRNLFISHASHTVPEESMAEAVSIIWRAIKHTLAYFNTHIINITLVHKIKIQKKCWDKRHKPRLSWANGNIWVSLALVTATGFKQGNYIIRFVLYRDSFEAPEAVQIW